MKSSIAAGFRPAAAAVAAALLAMAAPSWGQAGAAATGSNSTAPAPAGAAAGGTPAADAAQRSDPRRVAAVVEQVARLRKEGRRAEALEALEAALKTASRDAQLRFLYGVTMAEAGRRDDAVAVFEQLSSDFPELPEPYNNLAVMYAAAGDLDRARAALENAVRALPDYALAHENLGDLYLRMAVRSWERAGKADARNRSAPEKLERANERTRRVAPGAGDTPAKTRTIDEIRQALDSGVEDLGENYIQEAREKARKLPGARWHMVGNLQKNKVNLAVDLFEVIHSLDSVSLISRLEARCAARRLFSRRSSSENPRSEQSPWRSWSPSRMRTSSRPAWRLIS